MQSRVQSVLGHTGGATIGKSRVRCEIIEKVQHLPSDPVQALALVPLGQSDRMERQWLQDTLAWLKSAPPDKRAPLFQRLAEEILAQPAVREKFQQIWVKAFAARVYAEAGLPEATSLAREFLTRVKARVLPQLEDALDLYAALQAADLDRQDAEWFAGLPAEAVAPWRELLAASGADFPVAVRLLALRAAAIGLSRAAMKAMPHRYETESPFFDLVDAAGVFAKSPSDSAARRRFQEIVLRCRVSADISHARMEEQGVSSDLVFRLDLVIAQLDRIEMLLRVISGQEDGRTFGCILIRAFAGERSVRALLSNSVNRVARQIVTHTGKSGEHYIAGSRHEWFLMGCGALGAGAITAFTAMFKYLFAAMALAPLWIGVAHSLNYTLSFVLMQFLGWRLASKMPSMTAAALCDAMEKDDGMQAEIKLVAAIARTQTIVTVGNLLGAIPLAVLIDLFLLWMGGNPLLSPATARHGLDSMNPLRSFTIPFAALTGCFLWLSSLFAGWTANWMVIHRLPAAIAQSRRIRAVMGGEAAEELGELVDRHFSGVAGYTCLGLLLGLLPFVSVFAGVPLEVRHITLASASLAYAVSSLAWSAPLPWREIAWAGCGLLATGLLNFSVSFALGLWLAVRARNLDTRGRRTLLRDLWNEFRRHPSAFLWRQ
jgi:site-specific recombinase